jgi:TetR/AcrR family transcriptional regulator, transcriptional repressor for nem operon
MEIQNLFSRFLSERSFHLTLGTKGHLMTDVSTRDNLIEMGLQHMQETSYCSTGLNEVLALAGVSKGSFYHYFPSKEEFGSAVLQRYLELEVARATTLLGESKTAPIKRLRRYFEELISVYGPKGAMNGGCLLGNLSQEMANHSDLVQQTLQEGFRIWEVAIDAVLLEAVTRGELLPKAKTTEMASFILNSYEGALLRAKAERSEAPLRLFLQMIFGSFLIAG